MKRASERAFFLAGFFVTAIAIPALAVAAEPAGAAAAPDAAAPPAPAGASSDPQYVIGPGDDLQVFVWRNADLSVTVPRSLYSAVKLVGQVKNPQSVAFHEGLTVLDAVLLGGGLTDYAAGNRARSIRKEGGRTIEIKVHIKDMVERGNLDTNVALRPGDTLIVPESRF